MSERYWDQRIETLPRDTLARLQRHRLNWQMRRCWDASEFYRERLDAAGLDPAAFSDADILTRLPVLTLTELRAETATAPPFGRLTVAPEAWWVETDNNASGLRRVWTDGDVSHRADVAARALWAAGGRPGRPLNLPDRPANDLLARALTAGAARVAASPIDTHDAGTPGTGGPPTVFGHPLVGPVLAYECRERSGLHWAEDHLLVESIDGELVLTELTREGSPMLRLALGQAAELDLGSCGCGRTSARSTLIRPRA
jgi:phenylacetate-CoA ligase